VPLKGITFNLFATLTLALVRHTLAIRLWSLLTTFVNILKLLVWRWVSNFILNNLMTLVKPHTKHNPTFFLCTSYPSVKFYDQTSHANIPNLLIRHQAQQPWPFDWHNSRAHNSVMPRSLGSHLLQLCLPHFHFTEMTHVKFYFNHKKNVEDHNHVVCSTISRRQTKTP